MSRLPENARDLLGQGTLCYLAARARPGLHLTPVVFVLDGERLWATVARQTVKARAWKRDSATGGMVRVGDAAVTFRGRVTLYDALDPSTWPAAFLRGPALTRASTRFTLKNARFFAGYARDARHVPLAWTPPGRIVVSIDLQAGAVLRGPEVEERWGPWGGRIESRTNYRRTRGTRGPETRIPDEVRKRLGTSGPGALGLDARRGPVVLPVRWALVEGAYHAVLPRSALALAGAPAEFPAAMVLDRASAWRAAHMRGTLLRGRAQVFDPSKVRTGREALMARAARTGELSPDPVVIRLQARSAVWWLGWSSGTVPRR